MLEFKYVVICPCCYSGLSPVSILDAPWTLSSSVCKPWQTLDDLLVENQKFTQKNNKKPKCLSVSFLFAGPDIIKEVTVSGLSLRENESKLAFAQGILILVVILLIQSCSVKTADDFSSVNILLQLHVMQLSYFTMLLIPLQSFHDPQKYECKMCKYPPIFYWLASLYRSQVSKQAGLDISSLWCHKGHK